MSPFHPLAIVVLPLLLSLGGSIHAAPSSNILDFWAASNETSLVTVDHSNWQTVLSHNIVEKHPSGINRFDYGGISQADKQLLGDYIQYMQGLDPRSLNRAEQKAYWINLYNALTVNLIVSHYPVESITKLGDSLFSFGPWDDEIAEIEGQPLSLNDIEHRILRPIFQDNRIHYAVNCASLGCPNLGTRAYNAKDMEYLLDNAAREYINHPRGVDLKAGMLWVSSIYSWYRTDFGSSDQALLSHLLKYASPTLTKKLADYEGRIKDHYDWTLNQP